MSAPAPAPLDSCDPQEVQTLYVQALQAVRAGLDGARAVRARAQRELRTTRQEADRQRDDVHAEVAHADGLVETTMAALSAHLPDTTPVPALAPGEVDLDTGRQILAGALVAFDAQTRRARADLKVAEVRQRLGGHA